MVYRLLACRNQVNSASGGCIGTNGEWLTIKTTLYCGCKFETVEQNKQSAREISKRSDDSLKFTFGFSSFLSWFSCSSLPSVDKTMLAR